MPCRYCDVSFSIIKWKNKCQTCLCTFCTNCIIDKRCLACQRVLDSKLNQDELMKIKVKDLKIFSITRGYEVSTCKEKYELVNLIRGNAGLSTGCTGHVTPVAPTPAPDSIRIYPSSNNVPEPPNYRFTQDLFPTADEYLNISTASYVNESVPSQTPPVVPPTAEASAKKTEENTSSNTASSSDAVSLPKATGRGGKLLLTDIQFVAQIKLLSPRQLKQILADNFVDYKGCVEKTELLKKVADLYEDVQKNNARQAEEESRALQSNPDEDSTCRICWDKPIDCVLLECGHMTTCTNCGKKMNECPICRQYVVRCVHVFRT